MADKNIAFKLDKVSFLYKSFYNKAIDNISLIIEKGHFWGIIGPNGSGKTTLLDLLAGFRRPYSGKILFNGKNISEYNKKVLAKFISFMPQQFYTNIPFQVEDIILMGRYPFISRFSRPSSYDLHLAKYVIKLLDLTNLIKRYITELSRGEIQRVMFARVLVQDTPIILLDEPTSNMDISYALTTLEIIQEQIRKRGKTAIMAVHDINLASMYCDKLIIMRNGKVVSYGYTHNILNEETIKSIFNVECQIYNNDQYTGAKYVIFKKGIYKAANIHN